MTDKTNAPEEILDLVNENDEVIGEVAKGDANSNPTLIHREVGILVYDGDGRVLLQQRSFKKKAAPGVWEISAAGHVKKGQTYEEAAHMELAEELGIDAELHFVQKDLERIPTETRFSILFVGKYLGDEIKLEKDEVEQVRWITEEEFDEFCSTNKVGKISEGVVRQFWKEHPGTV